LVGELRATALGAAGTLRRHDRGGPRPLGGPCAQLPAPRRRVRLEVEDTHPHAPVATQRALTSRPHLIFGPYGSGPTLQALGATDRVIWNHEVLSRASTGRPFPVC